MANEFIIKHGFHSKGDSQVTGSLGITGISDVSASIAAKAEGTILYENGTGTDSIKPVAGGNLASGACGNVGGGRQNKAIGDQSTVGGGEHNCACASTRGRSAVAGGYYNKILNDSGHSVIAGGSINTICANQSNYGYAFIGGGYSNFIDTSGLYSTLAGGRSNCINADGATLSGCKLNCAT